LRIERSWVRLADVLLLHIPWQDVHSQTCLECHQAVAAYNLVYQSQGSHVLGLVGNRRSGVALALRHDSRTLVIYGLKRKMSTPPTLIMWYGRLLFTFSIKKICARPRPSAMPPFLSLENLLPLANCTRRLARRRRCVRTSRCTTSRRCLSSRCWRRWTRPPSTSSTVRWSAS